MYRSFNFLFEFFYELEKSPRSPRSPRSWQFSRFVVFPPSCSKPVPPIPSPLLPLSDRERCPFPRFSPSKSPRLASPTVDGTTLVRYVEIRSLRGLRGVRVFAVKSSPCILRSFLVCNFFMNSKKVPAAPAAPANGGYPVYDVFPSRSKPRHPSPSPQLPAGDRGAASRLPWGAMSPFPRFSPS